ncbi:MAG TPA: hypothetical protein VD994_16560, partial [Prosthecobacter sp.]|nr:hypothetical protein [Prosthecobacter sp.]
GNFNKTGEDGRTQPWVGDGVSIGTGAVLIGPIRIGDGAIIGANSVVTSDIGANMIAAGSPAKEIKQRWDLQTGRQL